MVLGTLSFEIPKCPFNSPISSNPDDFPTIMYEANNTCEVLSNRGSPYIEVIWTFPLHPSTTNHFRVTISGSQPCRDRYTTWFVRGDSCNQSVTECVTREEPASGRKICHVTCYHICSGDIGYLHFRISVKDVMRQSLALCHYVLTTEFKTVNPISIAWFKLHISEWSHTHVYSLDIPNNSWLFAYNIRTAYLTSVKLIIFINHLILFRIWISPNISPVRFMYPSTGMTHQLLRMVRTNHFI